MRQFILLPKCSVKLLGIEPLFLHRYICLNLNLEISNRYDLLPCKTRQDSMIMQVVPILLGFNRTAMRFNTLLKWFNSN